MAQLIRCPNRDCGYETPVSLDTPLHDLRCHQCGNPLQQTPKKGSSETFATIGVDAVVQTSPLLASVQAPLTTIGRYQIKSQIGRGGYGAVYRAFDPQLEREVAIKVLRPELLDSSEARIRFQREAKAAAKLLHANIVPVYDAGNDAEHDFIAYAFINGRPLNEIIPKEGMPSRKAVAIVIQLADALAFAHEQGIYHRDVKPGNVILDEKERPYLLDFGLAGFMVRDGQQLTNEGELLGTPAYMSPEQAIGEKSLIGPAADQYSLAIVLWHMLVGRPPFLGPITKVIHQVIAVPLDNPSKYKAEIDETLAKICLRAADKSPKKRFASTQEFAAALRQWLKQKSAASVQPSTINKKGSTTNKSQPNVNKAASNRAQEGKDRPLKNLPLQPKPGKMAAAHKLESTLAIPKKVWILIYGMIGTLAFALGLVIFWPKEKEWQPTLQASVLQPKPTERLNGTSTQPNENDRPRSDSRPMPTEANPEPYQNDRAKPNGSKSDKSDRGHNAIDSDIKALVLKDTYWQADKGTSQSIAGIRFYDGGKADIYDESGQKTQATWRLNQSKIYLQDNQQFSEYWGTITETTMQGFATNVRNQQWTWKLKQADLAQVPKPPVSISWANTTWKGLDADKKPFQLRLLPGGEAIYLQPPLGFKNCSWQQDGSYIKLNIGALHRITVDAEWKGKQLQGQAISDDQKRWPFMAEKMDEQPSPVVPSADGLEGSKWRFITSAGQTQTVRFLTKGIAELETPQLIMQFNWKLQSKKITIEYRGPNPSGLNLQWMTFGANTRMEKLDQDTVITIKLDGQLNGDKMSGTGKDTYTRTMVHNYTWTATREP